MYKLTPISLMVTAAVVLPITAGAYTVEDYRAQMRKELTQPATPPSQSQRFLVPIQPPMAPPTSPEQAAARAACMRMVDRAWASVWNCAASFECTTADVRRYDICN